jgi:membrane protease YdiL (CAAX protease family)
MSNASSEPPILAVVEKPVSRVPWPAWVGIPFIVFVFYGAQILGSVLVSLYPLLRHWPKAQSEAWFSANSILIQFLVFLLATVITIQLLRIYLRAFKVNLAFLGLKKPRWYDPLLGLLVVPIYYISFGVLVALATHIFPGLNVDQKQEIGFDHVAGHAQMFYTFVSLVILAPLLEEIVFRGFIYKTLRRPFGIIIAGLLTSLLFGAGHLLEGGSQGLLYIAGLQTFVLSIFLVGLREKTHNLWAGITLHASNNLIAFFVLFILPAK